MQYGLILPKPPVLLSVGPVRMDKVFYKNIKFVFSCFWIGIEIQNGPLTTVSLERSRVFCDGSGYFEGSFVECIETSKRVILGSERKTRSLCGSPMRPDTQGLTLKNKGLFEKRIST